MAIFNNQIKGTMAEKVIIIVLVAVIIGLLFVINHIFGVKEHYRCRVFELSKGKEGSNLVNVIPNTPSPTPPSVYYYRHVWKFINPTALPQERLNEMVAQMQTDGYRFDENANACGLLAFRQTVEVENEKQSEFSMKRYDE